MPINIREAVPADASDLARLRWTWRAESHPELPVKVENFVAAFAEWWDSTSDFVAFVATDGDQTIGMGFIALGSRVPDPSALVRRHADIQSVYVLPEYRNRGIGAKIVRSLIDYGRKVGCIRITVHSGNRAVPIYERAGFQHSRQLMMHPLTD